MSQCTFFKIVQVLLRDFQAVASALRFAAPPRG
jgi:hypothetical protein